MVRVVDSTPQALVDRAQFAPPKLVAKRYQFGGRPV